MFHQVPLKMLHGVVAFGSDAERIQKSWQNSVETTVTADLNSALHHANTVAVSGDVVLLSPACASFDLFKSFEARGDAFADRVREVLHL